MDFIIFSKFDVATHTCRGGVTCPGLKCQVSGQDEQGPGGAWGPVG